MTGQGDRPANSETRRTQTLTTARLVLRPFAAADAGRVRELVSDPDVAGPTLSIPHPVPDGAIEMWLAAVARAYDAGTESALAVVQRDDSSLIGEVTLRNISRENSRAELGYWLGRRWWHLGYCTEAARAIVEYGFRVLGLNRIHALHIGTNPGSGRVLEKLGMVREGVQRQHVLRDGRFEDIVLYGLLRSGFEAAAAGGRPEQPVAG